jgi:hydroxyethylthiazole kinase
LTSARAQDSDIKADLPGLSGLLLERLRAQGTRVHAITNAAAQSLTANLLLAGGGVPSLTVTPAEVVSFTRGAGALLVNLGTLDGERRTAIPIAIETAQGLGKPWALDPVFANASPVRLEFARALLSRRPTVVRCNAAEFSALAGPGPPGVVARAFATAHGTVLALTGATDLVTDGRALIRVAGGHPLMSRVTAMGCAATALVAAFTALHESSLEAAAAALLVVSVAGERAGGVAKGPGSFQVAFLDALFALTPDILVAHGRLA